MATVLLAEDDAGVRELLEYMLDGAGHTVLACGDGDSALRLALEHRPGVAVLDVGLPGLSGLQVCAALRDAPATADLPVLLVTALGGPADVAGGFAAGATDYLVKPFSAGDLLARVDAFLGTPAADHESGPSRPRSAPPVASRA
ncbi:response regulator transcription factor [Dactylosporangium matsuzakiense]|uniref:Response regulatory domain-containing protein n=1 Tax=Dactylosporangium matsuzakiense TaxID=53360 RepID=A0A9W6KRA2_9ACTN|nr:response regulator [Dactylosporangium matsuzakiense]UWZ47454.1 response regulator [Dactylosporangium matsuzakiense]GLL05209.1 hypothetical protein GCM10017581_069560 [Dactylosporangium matsuzakiense]